MDPVAHLTSAVEETATDLAGNGRRAGRSSTARRARLRRLLHQRGDAAGADAGRAAARDRGEARRAARRAARRRPWSAWRSPDRASSTCSWPTAGTWTRSPRCSRRARTSAPGAENEHVNRRVREREPDRPDDRSPPRATLPTATRWHASWSGPATAVEREYYVNDEGSQVRRFGESIQARARGEEPPDDGYQGDYVRELAERIEGAAEGDPEEVARRGIELMLEGVRASLDALPRADGSLLLRAHAARGRRDREGARAARRRLRARRRALAADDRVRRRQGPRAAPLERRADLLRDRHRLPPDKLERGVRPRDRRLGRRPPRPHQRA